MASKDEIPITETDTIADDDAPGPPISVPDSGDTGEGGKLKMIVQLVKKCLGVKDIAAMRLSLPASLLEPIPNLEYWHYLDRPDLFAAINDSNDPFERMLAALRFAFTKDLKFVHGKVCKPYNSVLGEHFRSHWDVIPVAYPTERSQPPIPQHLYTSSVLDSTAALAAPLSETASIKSAKSAKSTRSGLSFVSKVGKSPSTAATSVETNMDAQMSTLSLAGSAAEQDGVGDCGARVRIVYVTEQVSHHPPVSAYFASCPARSVQLMGIDQISAKVSGTTLRVSPGNFNKGIFVKLVGGPGEGEMYHITHPVASVNGILRGSFYVTVGDSTIVTCTGGRPGPKLRAVVEYKEESWLGKAHFLLEGVIHSYNEHETEHEEWTKVKHVPESRVIAVFDGSWRSRIRWRKIREFIPSSSTSSPAPSTTHLPVSTVPSAAVSRADLISRAADAEYTTLLDLSTLKIIPKAVRPLERQLPHESRKLWQSVTDRLVRKEFGEATKEKVAIEQRQRDEAAERKRKGVEFAPRYFKKDFESGIPELTAEGWAAIEEELNETTPESTKPGSKLASPTS